MFIIREYCCWNMEHVIGLLFVSGYCWKINSFLKQINHHLAAVTGRTYAVHNICLLSYECE